MGRYLIYFLVFAAAGCGPGIQGIPNCNENTSWRTVDSWTHSSGGSALANSIAVDSQDNVFVVAVQGGYPQSTSSIRKGAGGGSRWTTVESFDYGGTTNGAEHFNVWINSLDQIYVQGRGWDTSSKPHWYIRKSNDVGATWSTINDYSYSADGALPNYSGTGFVVLADGSYLSIGAGLTGSVQSLLVRRSSDLGANWNTVLDYQYAAGFSSSPRTIARADSGKLFIGAQGRDASGTTYWIILTSSDDGNTWSLSDRFSLASGVSAQVKGLFVLDPNTILATGWATESTGAYHWVTRRTQDGGGTWSTVDYVPANSDANGDIVQDFRGYLYAPGGIAAGSERIASIRRSRDFGLTWSTHDEIFLSASTDGTTRSLTRGPDGALYSISDVTDDSGDIHLVTRKLDCR